MSSLNIYECIDEYKRDNPKKKSNIKYKRVKEEDLDDENKDQKRRTAK